jgi:hypothetical protein
MKYGEETALCAPPPAWEAAVVVSQHWASRPALEFQSSVSAVTEAVQDSRLAVVAAEADRLVSDIAAAKLC